MRFTGVVTYSWRPSGNSMTTTAPLRGARSKRPTTARPGLRPTLRSTTSTIFKVAQGLRPQKRDLRLPCAARGGPHELRNGRRYDVALLADRPTALAGLRPG